MHKLWIRFSLSIGLFFLLLLLVPFGTLFVLDQTNVISLRDDEPDSQENEESVLEDLFDGVLGVTVAISGIGLALGVFLSRGLSAPIVEVVEAVKQIGAGDLKQRVPETNHSHELNDLARAVNTMAADLQHSEMLRNNMLADISHELRTPLTVLSGQLRASIDRVYQLDEEEMAHLYTQTQHLIRLVEDLRILAQAEANQLPLECVDVDLATLWDELEANFQLLAEEKQITLTVSAPASLPSIPADPGRLRQTFSNLLSNALRHTPAGGTIRVVCQQDDEFAVVTVADSGEGIAAEQLPYLFDRFYRADQSRTRDTGGSGLGLAIVRAIVEAHGGTIRADSAGLGKGSQFVMRLSVTS
ncbi:MAG: ATP-binding protein [Chloroflexota bacterium]